MTYAAALVLPASASALPAPASPEAASFPEQRLLPHSERQAPPALALSAAADVESAVLARMASCTSCSSICAEALAGELWRRTPASLAVGQAGEIPAAALAGEKIIHIRGGRVRRGIQDAVVLALGGDVATVTWSLPPFLKSFVTVAR